MILWSALLNNQWQIGLCDAPAKEPGQFCFAMLPFGCACCAGLKQREKLLEITGEQYYCCGGMLPFCCLKQPCDRNCIYLEAFICQPWVFETGDQRIKNWGQNGDRMG